MDIYKTSFNELNKASLADKHKVILVCEWVIKILLGIASIVNLAGEIYWKVSHFYQWAVKSFSIANLIQLSQLSNFITKSLVFIHELLSLLVLLPVQKLLNFPQLYFKLTNHLHLVGKNNTCLTTVYYTNITKSKWNFHIYIK